MLYSPLKPLSFESEGISQNASSDFDLSSDFESVCRYLKGETNTGTPSACVCVYGDLGCGQTTFLLKVCEKLVESHFVGKSEILCFRVRKGCNLQSLWNFLIEIAKEKQERGNVAVLSHSTVTLKEKYAVAQAFISSNYKLICVDSVDSDGGVVWSHLCQILNKLNDQRTIIQVSRKGWNCLAWTLTEALFVEVKGLTTAFCKNYIKTECSLKMKDEQISMVCSVTRNNPAALKLFCNVIEKFQLSSETVDRFLSSNGDQSSCQRSSQTTPSAIHVVLHFCFKFLDESERHVFRHLSQLREPLPMLDVPEVIEKLVVLGLVRKEACNVTTSLGESTIFTLSVASCLQSNSPLVSYTSVDEPLLEGELFSAFNAWFSLVSINLRELVSDAEKNVWPFVPEKWQYISNVGAAESYNIKELITAKNLKAPFLTQLDILEECLFHALKEERFRTVAALLFVTDRFSYWQGSSQRTLQLVEYLQSHSPDTAIAPQLIIRKVRIMKNSGDLQGAEQVLDELLAQKSHVGNWIYREKHHHQLVSAVCIQIKGDIQYNLGHWAEAARLLLDSLILFSTLPVADKKGIASSLALLGNCLQPMSLEQYLPLAQTYALTAGHPLLQAYFCAYEAAVRSVFTPLFYARHKCRAGEYLLCYSKLIPEGEQKQLHVKTSIQDFKESIQAHKEVQSLTSREEFYVFVCAVYKAALAYQELASVDNMQRGKHIEEISMLMYDHYCSFTGVIVLDDGIRKFIADCLDILGLQRFTDGMVSVEGQGSTDDQDKPSAGHKGNDLNGVNDLTNKSSFEAGNEHLCVKTKRDCRPDGIINRSGQETVDVLVDHEAVLRMREASYSVTENLKETQEYKEADFTSIVSSALTRSSLPSVDHAARTRTKQDNGLIGEAALPENEAADRDFTVDRDCVTKEIPDTDQPLREGYIQALPTVSRTATTLEAANSGIVRQGLDQDTVPFPCISSAALINCPPVLDKRQNLKLDQSHRVHGAIVWRFDSICKEWKPEKTLAYVGNPLELKKGKKGAQRDAFMVEFINQEDPLAKYVAKCYRKPKDLKQYQQDVICQMTARYYVGLFNQRLYHASLNFGHVQFLPVVLLQLNDESCPSRGVYNVEPFMAGEFVKLTNNYDYVKSDNKVFDLLLAFSHFSYQASNELLIIVDIQGWTPVDTRRCTFLTDPQIHSTVYKCFGSGNLGKDGFDVFWNKVHSKCNTICEKLGLVRPDV